MSDEMIKPDAAALVHAGIEHAESAGDIHASIPVWALRDLLARAAIEATTVKGDGLVERLRALSSVLRSGFLAPKTRDALITDEAADTITTLKGEIERLEHIVTAWAYAHDIDGAARNDLLKRLREGTDNVG